MQERILIVDDDPAVQSALYKALHKRGYWIDQATSAEIALEKMKGSRFDLLILDALRRAGGVQTEAAQALGPSPKNLWKKIRKHGIDVQRRG